MLKRLIPLWIATASFAAPAHAQADAWWHHITVLAHDSMRGRETGSPEHHKAAQYVANQFRAAGLAPAGPDGFLQPVAFVKRTLDESKSSLTLISAGKERRLTLGQDASLLPRYPLAARVDAPVIFVGYGLSLPQYGHDDLAGLDLDGKIVVYFTNIPKGLPGPVVSHMRAQAWPMFRARGAVGVITLSGGVGDDTLFIHQQRGRLAPAVMLADRSLDVLTGCQFAVTWNAARAQMLFDGAQQEFLTLALRADAGMSLPPFELKVRLRSTASVGDTPLSSENVAGVLRGSDPRLREEYVVVTAHLDHVGVGTPVNGDSIFNGAMDNASGTALLIETARALAPMRDSIKRSIIFLAVTAEEKGLLGSRYFANHPTVPVEKLVANLNTDMFLPLVPLKMIMANGLEESNLADDLRAVGRAMGLPVISDPEPEENRFIRSDQYSFILRGIPALSLKVGFTRDSPEHVLVKKFRADRYHQLSDDLEQPVDRQSAADFGRMYVALVKTVANRDTKPAWFDTSFFKTLAR